MLRADIIWFEAPRLFNRQAPTLFSARGVKVISSLVTEAFARCNLLFYLRNQRVNGRRPGSPGHAWQLPPSGSLHSPQQDVFRPDIFALLRRTASSRAAPHHVFRSFCKTVFPHRYSISPERLCY